MEFGSTEEKVLGIAYYCFPFCRQKKVYNGSFLNEAVETLATANFLSL